MENDRRKIELLKGLLLSMPGTPVLYYGDEIGMGDNVFLGDRDGVRTPMQWSFDRNGGFSRADPASLYLPPIMDPVYGFEAVNVEAQTRSPGSLLNWTKRLIAARRTRQSFGRGTLRFLYPRNRKVIAYLREWEGEVILVVANLARTAQAVELDLSDFRGRRVVEVLGRSEFPVIGDSPYLLTLQGHSFFWFELAATAESEAVETAGPEFVTLVMPHGWNDLFTRHNLPQLERDVIPAFLPRQRWFGGKDQKIRGVRVVASVELPPPPGDPGDARPAGYLPQLVEVTLSGGERQHYALPLAACWAPSGSEQRNALLPATLAELRQFRREGGLVDAASQDGFALALMAAIERQADVPVRGGNGGEGALRFRQTPLFAEAAPPERLVVRRPGAEQSNTSILFEEYGVLKVYRRVQAGVHPEIEMGRFLVERAGFANTPPLLGTIELSFSAEDAAEGRERTDGVSTGQAADSPIAIGVLFGFVRNQGDGWTMALNYLSRYLDDALNEAAPGAGPPDREVELPDPAHFFLGLARQPGLRTGEMHRALAECGGDDPAFAPEPITPADIAAWRRELQESAEDMLARLRSGRDRLPEPVQSIADQVIDGRDTLQNAIRQLAPEDVAAVKCRHHGDYHLGQVLAVQNDFYIIDFEGEPSRPMAQRRRKNSPLRDVAGMIRSFDYAASTAVRQIAETRPAALPRAAELAETWRERAVAGFRAAYRKATRGSPVFPANKLQGKALLDFFTLEKAVYEVNYELANRPAWVSIPLTGMLRVLAKAGGYS
jgi:maltose alpha-D-glucosyltransferase/alpha-amylase